jgi:tellurite methyltransferase
MSRDDRKKWNARYAEGAYVARTHASAYLMQWLPELPRGCALDLACGAGRNALALAAAGYTVDAVDISGVALTRARAESAARGLDVHWIEADLEHFDPLPARYALIVCVRYVNLELFARLPAALAPGGHVLLEQHLQTDADVEGPRDPAFRVAPGALTRILAGLELRESREGLETDPDGRNVALARLLARAPIARNGVARSRP